MRDRRHPLARTDLGALLRDARLDAGLTQAQLAAAVGTQQPAISRWERGADSPRVDTLVRLLRACGYRADLVLRHVDDVDRAQLRAQLDMEPRRRLASSRNISRMLAGARRA